MICIGITIGIGPSGALLHTIGIGTIVGIGIGVRQWKCTIILPNQLASESHSKILASTGAGF